ncbi:hypothetical protein SLS58_005176 [Diplodia intermedia]|uniref:Pentatricopeptide repeat-containing protein n=1 Tax=Diplodia intermedia TaxID=856260 RepID=A0ABR3TRL1_9PEZI
MAQVMRVWDLLLKASSSEPAAKKPQSSTGVESSTPMWSSLRLPWTTVRQMTRPHRYFGTRLNQFLPAIEAYKFNRISYSALVTFDILTRDNVESVLDEKLLTESRPFVVFLAHLIPGSLRLPLRQDNNSSNEMANLLERSHVSSTHVAALLSRIKDSADKCMPIIASVGRTLDAGRDNRFGSSADVDGENRDSEGILGIDGEVKSTEEGLANFYYGRIGRAYSEGKRLIIYDLWLEAYKALSRRKTTDPPVPPKLYNLALEALMANRLPEQAINVWNKMIENGIKPTIKTWTAMIDGCGKAKDTEGMEQIWVRMLNSGVQPDVYAWSARVSGMMRAARFRQGFAVLDEMAKIWTLAYKRAQSAAKKQRTKVDTAELPAKPSTAVLNGAITALASRPPRRNENFLGPVLTWAKSLDIQPDVITYNSLISLSLRSGNTEEAMNLLQRMELVKVQPDVATFSIILNSIFRSGATAKLSQEEQNEKVTAVLRNLETHGIELTEHIFGTLIDGLLKRHNNEAAARAVLAHMVTRGLQVPPHIYTALMTHYFDRQDLAAVDALWAHIEASGTVLDTVFFDRMIEQYARIYDVDRMLVFLKRMSNQGLTPGWPALQEVVVKLAEIGDWERFDEIVNDVEQGVGVARKGIRVSPDNVIHQFWKAVARKRALKPKPEPYQEIFPHAQQEKL